MKQLVVVSMLQQQSPSDRLQGISRTYELAQPDPEIVAALVRSLKFDASVDVRLAALDSLLRYKNNEQVRRGLVEALTQIQGEGIRVLYKTIYSERGDRDGMIGFACPRLIPASVPAGRRRPAPPPAGGR